MQTTKNTNAEGYPDCISSASIAVTAGFGYDKRLALKQDRPPLKGTGFDAKRQSF